MKSQCDRLLYALKSGASVTPMYALQSLGIFRLAARVRDLKNEGVEIGSRFVEVQNQFGEPCRVKKYFIRSDDKQTRPA
jgi:hypothetical protein